MAFLNAYIVFILKRGQDYVTGLTNDIDQVISEKRNKKFSLVYQKHFDDKVAAHKFEKQLNQWDNAKKEALIRGDNQLDVS